MTVVYALLLREEIVYTRLVCAVVERQDIFRQFVRVLRNGERRFRQRIIEPAALVVLIEVGGVDEQRSARQHVVVRPA